MRTTPVLLVVLAIFAGAASGVTAHLLSSQGDPSAAAPSGEALDPGRDELAREVERLRETVADLRGELGQVTLTAADAVERAKKLEERVEAKAEAAPTVALGDVDLTNLKDGAIRVSPGRQVVNLSGASFSAGAGKKMFELMRMSEEDRWQKLREELALDSYQETELKRIRDDMRAEMKEMFKVDASSGDARANFDFKKIAESRKSANERVKQLLSDEQYKKFEDEGYGRAMGLGGGAMISYATSVQVVEEEGK